MTAPTTPERACAVCRGPLRDRGVRVGPHGARACTSCVERAEIELHVRRQQSRARAELVRVEQMRRERTER